MPRLFRADEDRALMRGRLLPFEVRDAVSNMAIDEAISLSVAAKDQLPTLRFYGWKYPSLSLGYFQSHADAVAYLDANALASVPSETRSETRSGGRSDSPAEMRVELVRRSTGGGAILHHHELTYSLTLPLTDTGPGPRETVYRAMHASIQETLGEFGVMSLPHREFNPPVPLPTGDLVSIESASNPSETSSAGLLKRKEEPFLCFQRRTDEDLICAGYKILGSAQRRVRGGVLQHGSLLLSVSPWASVLPGIGELANANLDLNAFVAKVANQVGAQLGLRWEAASLHDREQESAIEIARERYAAAEWTRRR